MLDKQRPALYCLTRMMVETLATGHQGGCFMPLEIAKMLEVFALQNTFSTSTRVLNSFKTNMVRITVGDWSPNKHLQQQLGGNSLGLTANASDSFRGHYTLYSRLLNGNYWVRFKYVNLPKSSFKRLNYPGVVNL
jgi:hypothetical protein